MNKLIEIRKRLGVSQGALAAALGVSQGAISHCECGRQEVMPDFARKLIRYAAAKGVSVTFDDIYEVGDQVQPDRNEAA